MEKLKNNPYARVLYLGRLVKQEKEKQFSCFLEVFKKLQIYIPFAEVLEQMPSYAKFMKKLLSKKRKLKEDEIVPHTEECSVIIQRQLHTEAKGSWNFFHIMHH